MASGPTTSWEIDGETVETVSDFIFLGSKITTDGDCSHEIKRRLLLGRKVMVNLDSIFKSRDITLPTKVCSQDYGFSSSHVWMWELDCEEGWAPKNWCFWKDSDAERDWGQEEKGTTEDEMAGWHHWLNGHESGWTPGVDDGQGGLACGDSWGHKESDTTERLMWSDLIWSLCGFLLFILGAFNSKRIEDM